ncbi:DUF421 domain-containing protein [Microbulbifer yueqingensis]|uniref:Uncharacterized membrane protein YcaP, DUF421 family n=1 Tax=Microbulbifer yueqingensis TaxID=658219 RepID=A0A1G9D361_9GAMM|nr:YetF domain-containing protein [Microbulbifer yueqingensis]SDK58134.1 Uncharacterized membrane protein YcaP, DUF421 family [Microbulbifer yueqingensis]
MPEADFFQDLLISDWKGILRVLVSAMITYVVVVCLVRLSGKRSASQMNNFDWIVTVAIGSIVGSTIVIRDLPLAEGLSAVLALLAAQFMVTKATVYFPGFSSLLRAAPVIVFWNGEFVRSAMKKQRVTEQEVLSAIRKRGVHRLEQVAAVVIEADARLSVLLKETAESLERSETLERVKNYSSLVSGSHDAP